MKKKTKKRWTAAKNPRDYMTKVKVKDFIRKKN